MLSFVHSMLLNIITITLFSLYGLLILYYWTGWRNIPQFLSSKKNSGLKISVVIPARDEEENIGRLLSALQEQTYPKEFFEVIVIDDQSTDKTTEVVRKFPEVRLLHLEKQTINSYKKKAIEKGIESATGELIVTTDADCVPTEQWLQIIADFKQETGYVFLAAPVCFENDSSLLSAFQALDFMVLQGITGASANNKIHPLCNGANLAYEKKVFAEVDGFSGIDNFASGDDMLLMNKIIKKYPEKTGYLKSKEAIVTTQPMKRWKEFFNQRIRWASKALYYKNWKTTSVLFLVYLFNLLFPVLLIAGFFDFQYWIWLGGLWIAKTMVEFPFVFSLAIFFNKQSLLKYFLFFQPLHILYTIIAGLFGQFGKYEWKGRKVK